MTYKFNVSALTVLLSILFSVTVQAQGTVRIFGKTVNEDGKPIVGVTLRIDNQNLATTSNNMGTYQFSKETHLPAQIKATAVGYYPSTTTLDRVTWNTASGLIITLVKNDQQLDEVLVTGRRNNSYLTNGVELGGKFAGKLKDLPQSVSVVSKEFMEDKQAFLITDMVHDLAGVNQASAYDDFTIRGFKSGYENGLRLVNGLRSSYGYGTSYFRPPLTINLESIEVLKGPGASLFGDITPGGTINMVTKKPLEEHYGAVNFTIGGFQTMRSTLDIGGPLDAEKKVLYRFNVGYENSKTFRDVNQRKTFAIAPSFTFKPAKGTQVDVDLLYDNFNGYLDRGMGIKSNNLYALSRSFTLSQPSDFYRTKNISLTARLKQEIGPHLTLNVSYAKAIYQEELNEHRTLNTFANPPQNTVMNMRFFEKSLKDYTDNMVAYLNYNLRTGRVNQHIVLGVDHAQYKGDPNNQQKEARSMMVNGTAVPLTFDLENPTYALRDVNSYIWRPQASFPFLSPYRSTGIYIQDQLTIDRLHLIVGLRHEHYYSSSPDVKTPYSGTQNAWLPRLGLTYTLNDQINYFASYAQGYVPVASNYVANYQDYGADKPFTAERSYQIETGFKTGFFQNQLQMDLSLYHIQRENMMVSTGETSETGFPIYRQSGRVTSRGIELDLRGQITKELQLMGNYSFNVTDVKESSIPAEIGMPLGNAPKNMGGAWVKYVFSAHALKGLGFGTGVYYVGSRRMDNPIGKDAQGLDTWGFLPGYTTVNAALYYHVGALKVAANLNNVFDKYYYVGAFDYTRAFPGAPRHLMLSLGYRF
ncbi:TonB-dependent siderophore receptor [Sphingobacterium psychroaquaticum]|uniref:TonB-dependent receptor n=1 Tax=Sphingobacterium psychroaquaticum TaxID=561061 RepID=UPI00106AA434|nr:TonB-dependent receptor [Sphingobacterium psychroaquaticum]QBQ42888.1 TonB-dependent siderophore receptor [Sphingobacterium psychroaquaticum]